MPVRLCMGRLAEMVLQFPASFTNRLDETLRQNKALDKENRDLKKLEIRDLREEKESKGLMEEIERKDREIQELKLKLNS